MFYLFATWHVKNMKYIAKRFWRETNVLVLPVMSALVNLVKCIIIGTHVTGKMTVP